MNKIHISVSVVAGALAGALAISANAQAPTRPAAPAAARPAAAKPPMGFFVTSHTPSGTGNLGGLAGADKTCQDLAASVGAGNRTWHAYLSAVVEHGPTINARDRIGRGPWFNAKGDLIASDVNELHGDFQRDRANLSKKTILNEKGEENPGSGDKNSTHDILTGSDFDGRVVNLLGFDSTCANWTSDSDAHKAIVGHSDRTDGNASWNSTHMSHGCSKAKLAESSSTGQFYCFAVD